MIIVNADDWGSSPIETNAALACYREERISSVSAMVFMEDSVRASALAKETGIDTGLHINAALFRRSAAAVTGGLPRARGQFPGSAQIRVLDLQPCAQKSVSLRLSSAD